MPKANTSVPSRKRRKKIMKGARGYYGMRKSSLRLAKEATDRAGVYAYFHRKKKKSDFRSLWIIRISAAAKQAGTSYSSLISGLKKAGVSLDRKILADLALYDSAAFQKIVSLAQAA